MDVVGEEDCTDRKMDEVYRPSVVSIKTEYEVSIVALLYDVFVVPIYVCVCMLFHACLGKQLFLVSTGAQVKCQPVDI